MLLIYINIYTVNICDGLVNIKNIHNDVQFKLVLCAGVPEAGAPPELRHFLVRQAGAGVWVISSSSGQKISMTKNMTISTKLCSQIMVILNLLNVHMILSVESDHINYHKRPNYHNLLCLQASCFDALSYVVLLCAASLGMSAVFMCCGSKYRYQVTKYLFIFLYQLYIYYMDN